MNKYIPIISVAIIILSFSGCSQKSMIEKVSNSKSHFDDAVYEGQDFYKSNKKVQGEKYRIFHQASSGFSGTSGIRRSAEQRADQFCKDLDENKKMFKVSEHTAKPPYILGNFPRIEIIFTCIDEKNEVQYLPKKDKYEKLSTLKILLDNGTLTQQEFEKEKNNILNN